MDLYLIHTADRMLISRYPYRDWRAIQDDFPDYMTSLGPWHASEMAAYLEEAHPLLHPSAEDQISALLDGGPESRELTFR